MLDLGKVQKCNHRLDKVYSRENKLTLVYQWVQQNHITQKEFNWLIASIYSQS